MLDTILKAAPVLVAFSVLPVTMPSVRGQVSAKEEPRPSHERGPRQGGKATLEPQAEAKPEVDPRLKALLLIPAWI